MGSWAAPRRHGGTLASTGPSQVWWRRWVWTSSAWQTLRIPLCQQPPVLVTHAAATSDTAFMMKQRCERYFSSRPRRQLGTDGTATHVTCTRATGACCVSRETCHKAGTSAKQHTAHIYHFLWVGGWTRRSVGRRGRQPRSATNIITTPAVRKARSLSMGSTQLPGML